MRSLTIRRNTRQAAIAPYGLSKSFVVIGLLPSFFISITEEYGWFTGFPSTDISKPETDSFGDGCNET